MIYLLGDPSTYLFIILKGSVVILANTSTSSLSIPLTTNFLHTQESSINLGSFSKSPEKSKIKEKVDDSTKKSIKIIQSFPDISDEDSDTSLGNSKISSNLTHRLLPKTQGSLDNLSYNNDICFNNQTIIDSLNEDCLESAISPKYDDKRLNHRIKTISKNPSSHMDIKYQLSYGNYFGGIASKNGLKK